MTDGIVYRGEITADYGDELLLADAQEFTSDEEATEWVQTVLPIFLRDGKHIGYVSEGRIVDMGDEDVDGEWMEDRVFESTGGGHPVDP